MRSEGNRLLEAIDELIEISRRAKLPAEIYHLKAAGQQNWGKLDAAVKKVEEARASGLRVTADMYNYTAGATGTISLRAINDINAASGNDFALDNLSFASAVPEPSTWAMLFLGFGVIGLMMRRRQARGLTIAA